MADRTQQERPMDPRPVPSERVPRERSAPIPPPVEHREHRSIDPNPPFGDDRRTGYNRDMIELGHERGQFEKESLEVTLEGRIALMTALAARIREVCAGLQGHPRIREMVPDDRQALRDAVEDSSNLAMSLASFTQALLEQAPTRAGRERQAARAEAQAQRPDPRSEPPRPEPARQYPYSSEPRRGYER